jgi:hypothetical protein
LATVEADNAGPLHAYVEAPPAPLALSVTVPPLHIGLLFVGAAVGVEFTVTEVVYTVEGLQPECPEPSVTVNEYTLVAVGVAVVLAPVVAASEVPLHA